ncbi:hypothetical protein [Candidatus Tisiphia endosymbiont of Dioctria rufipes]|uniref:hypothetical protein n=1 Tax=Candidatus Tisiphia endosymbiont of Dioctria rufipes TaxID=3066255 RepID=UPI00312C9FBE
MTKNIYQNTIFNFLDNKRVQKILGSAVMVALAGYFQLSIDEMIGRIPIDSPNKILKLDINSH